MLLLREIVVVYEVALFCSCRVLALPASSCLIQTRLCLPYLSRRCFSLLLIVLHTLLAPDSGGRVIIGRAALPEEAGGDDALLVGLGGQVPVCCVLALVVVHGGVGVRRGQPGSVLVLVAPLLEQAQPTAALLREAGRGRRCRQVVLERRCCRYVVLVDDAGGGAALRPA